MNSVLYKSTITLAILLISISAIGELLFPTRMLTFAGITSSPQTNFLVQTTAVALVALLPGLWMAFRYPDSPASRSILFGIAAYLFLSSAVDYNAYTHGIVNVMSIPGIIFRVLLGGMILWIAFRKTEN